MRQKQGVFSLFLLSPSSRRAWIEMLMCLCTGESYGSPSSRRAWIEMAPLAVVGRAPKSPSSRRAWIEIDIIPQQQKNRCVALLAEGVDRNIEAKIALDHGNPSPSSRRAWIEMPLILRRSRQRRVALLAEGVDRNFHIAVDGFRVVSGRPPRGGRG